ncbi:hypothetical protein PLICRDRAFT_40919 [Plicaturopsis crispa FD-325 SS-3]|nr:hypothetical protein PLICRDRAFT_40919 [Plicaturopsis crispa FD-325 SS-3]
MRLSVIAIALPVFLASSAAAWGSLGHQAVGYVAMEFLAPKSLAFVKKTISAQFNHSLGPAGPWADTVREEAAFRFSAPFHFIDAEDDPEGGSCSVVQSRDCGSSGCILTAIANYTTRVVDTSLGATQVQQALMFLDHFLGDIGQPLHVEAFEVGGNDIDAICGGKSTNLHATWDTGMIETMLDANFSGSVTSWANSLISDIKTGSFESDASGWISCSSTTETQVSSKRELAGLLGTRAHDLKAEIIATIAGRSTEALACPLVWAKESNAFDCSAVFNFKTGQDLCTGSYFKTAIPIINLQIAKQGFRLAAWLNVLFDGATDLP